MRPDKMTHEVCCNFEYGSITFQVAAEFFGEGDPEDGVMEMLESMYPEANSVLVTSLKSMEE